MRHRRLIAFSILAALLGACGTTGTTGQCRGPGICPIVIVQTSPGRFVAQPDTVISQNGTAPTLVWMFADSGLNRFDLTIPPNPIGDGIQLSQNPQRGIYNCGVTADPTGASWGLLRGPYYRCDVRSGADGFATSYQISFRDDKGTQRTLDPGVTNTGHGIIDASPAASRTVYAPSPAASSVTTSITVNGTSVTVDPLVTQLVDPVETDVIWAAPGGYVFDRNPSSGDADGIGVVGNQNYDVACWATDGSGARLDKGPYYVCPFYASLVMSGGIADYTITFRDGTGTQRSASGQLKR